MIYIIRHGQTANNKKNVLQGRSNAPLNETGIRQAQEAARFFREKGTRFDAVYSSPLTRAIQTARIITGAVADEGAEPGTGGSAAPRIMLDERLIEMDYGPYEGMDLTDPAPEVLAFFKDFVNTPAPKGMEALDHIVARAGRFIEELKPLFNRAGRTADKGGASADAQPNILISTHAIAMKGVLEYLTPDSHGGYWSKYIGNCAVYEIGFEDGGFSVPRCVRST